jgi:hypothetical protein
MIVAPVLEVDDWLQVNGSGSGPVAQVRRVDVAVPSAVAPRLQRELGTIGIELVLGQRSGKLDIGLGVSEGCLERAGIGKGMAEHDASLGGAEVVPLAPRIGCPVARVAGDRRRADCRAVDQPLHIGAVAAVPGFQYFGLRKGTLGYDVDHAACGIGAVERGVGPLDDIDPLDQISVDGIKAGHAVGVGDRDAVEQDHDLPDAVPGLQAGASDDQAGIVAAILGLGLYARSPLERLAQAEHLGVLDLLLGDGAYAGRHLLDWAFGPRCGHFHFFKALFGPCGLLRFLGEKGGCG